MKAKPNGGSYGHFITPLKDEPGKFVLGFYVMLDGREQRKIRLGGNEAAERFATTWKTEMPKSCT